MQINFENLYSFIIDEYKIAYIIINKAFLIKSFSPTVEKFLDTKLIKDSDIRDYFFEFIGYEEDFDAIHQQQSKEFQLLTVNKNHFYLDIHIKKFDDSENLVIFITDVTHRMNTQQLLLQDRNENELRSRELIYENKQKDKMMMLQSRHAQMGEMISMIAHQWRQPLTVISILIQGIYIKFHTNRLNEKNMEKFQKSTQEQIQLMAHTINDFKDFFKPEKEKKNFNLTDTIYHVIKLLHPLLEDEKIHIETTLLENIVISGYSNEFAQTLINIFTNAKDALSLLPQDIQKVIKVYTIQNQNTISIHIEDNAGGVSPEIIDTIFKPYFSTKKKEEGTGLGLYMSKMIIEEYMDGHITVRNGKDGAIFTIVLTLVNIIQ